jgi:hypothetical protein
MGGVCVNAACEVLYATSDAAAAESSAPAGEPSADPAQLRVAVPIAAEHSILSP